MKVLAELLKSYNIVIVGVGETKKSFIQVREGFVEVACSGFSLVKAEIEVKGGRKSAPYKSRDAW